MKPGAGDDWVRHHIVVKNTFLEVAPPLFERPSGFRDVRRQISDPLTCTGFRDLESQDAAISNQQKLCLDKMVQQCEMVVVPQVWTQPDDDAAMKANSRCNKMPPPEDGGGQLRIKTRQPILLDQSLNHTADNNMYYNGGGNQSTEVMEHVDGGPNVLQRVPVGPDGQLTSVGSALHAQKKCSPCAFFHASVRCREGVMCAFCHFNHSIKVRIRPCKGKRERYKKLKDHLFSRIENDPTGFDPSTLNLPPSIAEDEILKAKLMTSLADHLEQVLNNRRN